MGKTPVKYLIFKAVTDRVKVLMKSHHCLIISHPIVVLHPLRFVVIPIMLRLV